MSVINSIAEIGRSKKFDKTYQVIRGIIFTFGVLLIFCGAKDGLRLPDFILVEFFLKFCGIAIIVIAAKNN
ncbi:MAG: hypothetical protein ABIG10_00135 [bacterium]